MAMTMMTMIVMMMGPSGNMIKMIMTSMVMPNMM